VRAVRPRERDGVRRLLRLELRDRVLERFDEDPLRGFRDVLVLRDPGGEDVRVAIGRP
jgi:hypothetical protein